jgi:hypothetical protein
LYNKVFPELERYRNTMSIKTLDGPLSQYLRLLLTGRAALT